MSPIGTDPTRPTPHLRTLPCPPQALLDEAMEQVLFSDGTAWEVARPPTGLRPAALELLHALVAVQVRVRGRRDGRGSGMHCLLPGASLALATLTCPAHACRRSWPRWPPPCCARRWRSCCWACWTALRRWGEGCAAGGAAAGMHG